MKFICEKSILQEAISNVQKAITGKSTMPVLTRNTYNCKNKEVTLIGSDIDLSIEAKITADVIEDGTVVLDSKLFGEIIRKLPNSAIEITSAENNSIKIVCQKSYATIVHMNGDDYPNLPNIIENMIFSISQRVLKNMMKGTIFAVAQDETRPILTGVLFEIKDKKLNLVALDGYRVAFRSERVDNDSSITAVIPGKTLSEVSKILEETDENVNITFTPNHILFNIGKTKVISRLLEGEFIKYSSIIPEEYNLKITAKRSELLSCIERASLMAKEGNTNLVKFNIEEDNMIITSNSQLGKAREEINIILQGEPLQIAFNSKYLIELLKIMEEEEIIMEFSSGVNPCVVKNKEKDNCTYMVLPVRIRATNN